MTVPDDANTVLTAIRLGWSIAEVRGRNRPDAPPGARVRLPGPPGHALPLHVEQTPPELRIAAQAVLAAMARELGVDSGGADQASYSQAIDAQTKALARAREGARAGGAAADGAALGGAPAMEGGAAGAAPALDGVAAGGAPALEGVALGGAVGADGAAAPVAMAADVQVGADAPMAADSSMDADAVIAARIPAVASAPDMPSLPETRIPLLPGKRARQNKQLVRMARERGITPVTPN